MTSVKKFDEAIIYDFVLQYKSFFLKFDIILSAPYSLIRETINLKFYILVPVSVLMG